MSWVLALFSLILLISVWNGYRLGFIRTVFSVFTVFAGILTAFVISPKVCNMVCQNQEIVQMIEERVFAAEEKEKAVSKSEQKKTIENMKLPEVLQKALKENNNEEIYQMLGVSSFEDYVKHYLTVLIIKIAVYFITYVLILILLQILCALLDVVSRLPVLDGLNKTAGLLIGLVKGVIVVELLMVAVFLIQNTSIGMSAMDQIMENTMLNWMYNNNLILKILMNLEELFL